MRKRLFASVPVAAATALALGALMAGPAMAQGGGGGGGGGGGRPCGPSHSTSGQGSLGSGFTLKSMYDDNAGAVVVGEEFEIAVPAGQVWTVTFSDNGTVFFSGDVTSDAAGVRVVEMTAYHGGTSHMAAHALSKQSGETVDGAVDLPVAPATCTGH
jgi:hypothetical protein